jgi:hypothetical protein
MYHLEGQTQGGTICYNVTLDGAQRESLVPPYTHGSVCLSLCLSPSLNVTLGEFRLDTGLTHVPFPVPGTTHVIPTEYLNMLILR